jgi:hypothetical protein
LMSHRRLHQRAKTAPTKAVTAACQNAVGAVHPPEMLLAAPRINPITAPKIIIAFMLCHSPSKTFASHF